MDKNVSNYTLYELMAIAKIENLEPNEIVNKTNNIIQKFKYTNPEMSIFFKNIQYRLLMNSSGNTYEDDSDSNDYENDNDNTDNNNENDSNNNENDNDDESNENDKINNKKIENFQNMNTNTNTNTNINTNTNTNTNTNKSNDKSKKYSSQAEKWYSNQYLKQDNPIQTDKITTRQDTTKLFENQHVPMKKEQVATTDTFEVPVKQDSLNPNLKNTTKRFVNLDSQFRQYTSGTESISTDYTLDLSDTLKNVLKLGVYSFQIPQSWYVIDKFYGNTCFWIVDGSHSIPISVPSGNYTQETFKVQLNKSFTDAGFSFNSEPVQYNENNGIISLHLYDVTFNGIINEESVTFTISEETIILFYDFTGFLQCNNNCSSKTNRCLNSSLGWLMGYRLPYINVNIDGNFAPAILDLNGTKYLILVVDDYNQNHVNSNIVSISQYSSTLKVPNYYSPDIPRVCINAQQGNNLDELIAGVTEKSLVDFQSTNPLNGLLIGAKYEEQHTKVEQILPSAPRTLTQSQIYTINEIKKNRSNNINYLVRAPTTADILAILPVKTSIGVTTGSLLVEFSGSLQENSRIYFGPVDIDRLSVRLLDDKGNILNLNGMDWCVTFVCECLYQY